MEVWHFLQAAEEVVRAGRETAVNAVNLREWFLAFLSRPVRTVFNCKKLFELFSMDSNCSHWHYRTYLLGAFCSFK